MKCTYARSSSRAGTEWISLRFYFRKFGVFRRIVHQNWAPVVTERTVERGIQLANFRLGFSRTVLIWRDEKSPRVEQRFW